MKNLKLFILVFSLAFCLSAFAEDNESALADVKHELASYIFQDTEITTANVSENNCNKHIERVKIRGNGDETNIAWSVTENKCLCTNKGSMDTSCNTEVIGNYTAKMMAGDNDVASDSNQCMQGALPTGEFTIAKNHEGQYETNCTLKGGLYTLKGGLISQDEIKSLSKRDGVLSTGHNSIVENPLKECKKVWGVASYINSPTINMPGGNYLCAQAEMSPACNPLKKFYDKVSNAPAAEIIGAIIKHAIYLNSSNGGTSYTEDSGNADNSNDDATITFTTSTTTDQIGAPVLKINEVMVEHAVEGIKQPVITVTLGDSTFKILPCPKLIKAKLKELKPTDPEQIQSCKNELLSTILGTEELVATVNSSGSKNVLPGANVFLTMNQCRNAAVADIIETKVIPCRSFQAIAKTFNKYEPGKQKYATFDAKYTCRKDDMFTADFNFCKKLVNTYNANAVTENAGKMAESVSMADAKIKASNMIAQDPTNAQSAAVDGAKSIVQRKITHEWTKVGLYSTHAALFGGFLINWPTPKNLGKRCTKNNGGVAGQACCTHAAANYFSQIFKNYDMKKQFAYQLFYALGKAGAAGVMASLYKKQKGQLQDVSDELDGLEVEDYNGLPQDMLANLCQQNPSAPGCTGGRNLINHDVVGQGNINFNGAGGQQMGAASGFDTVDYGLEGESHPNLSDDDIAAINDTIAGTSKSSGGFEDHATAASSSAREKTAGSGGGGRASASSGGLGRAPKDGGKSGSKLVTGSGRASKRDKNSGFSYGSSGYRYNRGGKKDSNPFSGLFGKKGNKGGVKVDRSLAGQIGSKKFGIFEKISNRYNVLKKSKRLLVYEEE
jgi:hypothetical protein